MFREHLPVNLSMKDKKGMKKRLDFRVTKGTKLANGGHQFRAAGPSVEHPVSGKAVRLQKSFSSELKALAFCEEMNELLSQRGQQGLVDFWFGGAVKTEVETASEFTAETAWLKFYEFLAGKVAVDDIAESTRQNYKVVVCDKLLPYLRRVGLADSPIIRIRKSVIQSFLDEEAKRGVKSTTRGTQKSSIQGFFTWFLEMQERVNDDRVVAGLPPVRWLDINPAKGVVVAGDKSKMAVKVGDLRKKAFTTAQEQAMLEALDGTHTKPLFQMMLWTGLRPSEAVGLVWENVVMNDHDKTALIRVESHETDGVRFRIKTEVSAREFLVGENVYNLLDAQRKKTHGVLFVFRQIKDPEKPLSRKSLSLALVDAKERANKTLSKDEQILEGQTAHACRHTYITRMVDVSNDYAAIMKRVGHSSWKTFSGYISKSSEKDMELANMLK